jgi:hypothetical protein
MSQGEVIRERLLVVKLKFQKEKGHFQGENLESVHVQTSRE